MSKAKAIVGVVTGGVLLAGGFLAGREFAPEESSKKADTFAEAFQNTNETCARAVLEAAKLQFTYIDNDAETVADEEHDSKLKAQTEGDTYVKDEMTKCMAEAVTSHEIQIPVFKPVMQEGN